MMNAASLLLLLVAPGQDAAPLSPPLPLDLRPEAPAAAPMGLESPAAPPAAGLLEPTPAVPLAPPPTGGQPTLAPPPSFAPAPSPTLAPAAAPSGGFRPRPAAPTFAPAAVNPAEEGAALAPAAALAPPAASPRFAPAPAYIDPNAAPVSSAQPLQPAQPQPPAPAANPVVQVLLDASLQAPSRNALAGNPVTLQEALGRASDSTRRLAITKHYWFVTYLVGEYHLALEQLDQLQAIGQPAGQRDQLALEAAKAAALAKVHEAELNAVVAQYELADLAMLPVGDTLPLPTDRPFVGQYGTKFEAIFAGRVAPLALRKIDRTLPLRQRLIGTQASSAAVASDEFAADFEGYRGGQVALTSVLAAQQKAHATRSAFLMAVRQYNFDIAEYVAAVAAPNISATTFIEMLIGSNRGPQRSVLVANGSNTIRPVAATTPLQPTPAQGFAAPIGSAAPVGGFAPVNPNLVPSAEYAPQPTQPLQPVQPLQPAQPQFQSIPAGGIPLREVSDLPSAGGER